MKVLNTAIDIEASKETVWDILVDFEKYPTWNPFIKSIKGDLKVRNKLEVSIQPPGAKVFKFKPKVTSYKRYKEFSWLGSLFMYGLFDGHHVFEIAENQNGTSKLIHKESFRGILVPILWNKLNTETRMGFESMNKSLKELAENESH